MGASHHTPPTQPEPKSSRRQKATSTTSTMGMSSSSGSSSALERDSRKFHATSLAAVSISSGECNSPTDHTSQESLVAMVSLVRRKRRRLSAAEGASRPRPSCRNSANKMSNPITSSSWSWPFKSNQSSPTHNCSYSHSYRDHRRPSPHSQPFTLMAFYLIAAVAVGLTCGQLGQLEARLTFEKMTNRDYSGVNYYTMQNVSLFECLGWCKDDASCTSAVFNFVVNPFAALQETTCMLQNETQARQGPYLSRDHHQQQQQTTTTTTTTVVSQPQKATNLYFFNKIELPTEAVCSRLWAFERFPNKRLRATRDRQPFHAGSKEACQAACMNEQRFVCRSLEYNYISQQCTLSGFDRRSPLIIHLAAAQQQQASINAMNSINSIGSSAPVGAAAASDLIDSPGTDYFENACLLGEDICNESRIYDYAKVGLPLQRVAHFVELNYYPDKEMLVKSQAGCVRACTIEHEFICRSILYRSTFKQGQPNCALYHLDQRTFPEGAEAFMSHVMQPLLDSGETSAVYLEAVCNDTIVVASTPTSASQLVSVTQPTSLGGSSGPQREQQQQQTTITMPPTSITILPSATTPGGISVYPSAGSSSSALSSQHHHNNHHNGHNHQHQHHNQTSQDQLERLIHGSSQQQQQMLTSTLSPLGGGPPTTIRLPTSFMPPTNPRLPAPPDNIHLSELPSSSSSSSTSASATGAAGRPLVGLPSHITISPGDQGGSGSGNGNQQQQQQNRLRPAMPAHITISPAPPPASGLIGLDQGQSAGSLQISATGGPASQANHDQNCDAHGFCYDVALKCTDTKMVVNVKTQRPFFGRIYALGRSETCNANIKNQNQFQLDMYLTGQECNTQSASGTYTNTIVLQHHNVVLTKADKVYHVRCTYETASRNVSFGMMPVKDMFEVDLNDRNQETISITASSDAPLPKISILTLEGKEASTVRIGDRLTFRIEIPDNTPYGIFARSCIAMAKDARSTFEIIDEHGCPVDHTIFPNFLPVANGNALESNYEAFRFTESYGVIFQCNVKYCIGKCEPVNCGIGRDSVEAWGRRKRSIKERPPGVGSQLGDDMTLSREIVVLDLKDKQSPGGGRGNEDNEDGDDGLPASNDISSMAARSMAQKSPLKSSSNQNQNHRNDDLNNNNNNADGGSLANGDPTNQQLHCVTGRSLLLLICSIGLFFVLYVCLVAYFFARRDSRISVIKHNSYH